jgi:hypothetical protein
MMTLLEQVTAVLDEGDAGRPEHTPVRRVAELVVDRDEARAEVDRLRAALELIAAVDPYSMDPNPDMSREAQNWATLNGVVTWARQALSAPVDRASQNDIDNPENG